MTEDEQKAVAYGGDRPDVRSLIAPPPSIVLDIGCSTGELGARLAQLGAEVWGIEIDEKSAEVADTKLDRVVRGDALDALDEIADSGKSFDCIVCADSLEHMDNPSAVLRRAVSLLDTGGQCIVSLPNVRFYSTLTALIFRGTWPMKPRGLHDSTHLRWFTKRDAEVMLSDAGLKVVDTLTHYRIVDTPSRINRLARGLAVPGVRGFFAYQYVFRTVRA